MRRPVQLGRRPIKRGVDEFIQLLTDNETIADYVEVIVLPVAGARRHTLEDQPFGQFAFCLIASNYTEILYHPIFALPVPRRRVYFAQSCVFERNADFPFGP
jgi:hypothetical protein